MGRYRVVVEATSFATYEFDAETEADAKEYAIDLLKEDGIEYQAEATLQEQPND